MVWNMMGWSGAGCGFGTGYGFIGALYSLFVLAILALIVVWLYKQVFEDKTRRKK